MISDALEAMKATPYGTALALALAGGAALWGGTEYVKSIVANEAPYTRERGIILEGLERTKSIEAEVRAIRDRLARIETKIDALGR